MAKIFLIMLAIVAMAACSPVRTGQSTKAPRGETNGRQETQQTSETQTRGDATRPTDEKPVLQRFSDTTFIYLDGYRQAKPANVPKKSLNNALTEAIRLFDDGNTNEACSRISDILSNLSKASPDYPETLFYTSECYIAKNQFEPARRLLIEILERDDLTDEITEKSLVRLGQIYCITGDQSSAERLFRQLRRQFPNSIYKQIADCDAVGK